MVVVIMPAVGEDWRATRRTRCCPGIETTARRHAIGQRGLI